MTSNQLTQAQARQMHTALLPTLRYLNRLPSALKRLHRFLRTPRILLDRCPGARENFTKTPTVWWAWRAESGFRDFAALLSQLSSCRNSSVYTVTVGPVEPMKRMFGFGQSTGSGTTSIRSVQSGQFVGGPVAMATTCVRPDDLDYIAVPEPESEKETGWAQEGMAAAAFWILLPFLLVVLVLVLLFAFRLFSPTRDWAVIVSCLPTLLLQIVLLLLFPGFFVVEAANAKELILERSPHEKSGEALERQKKLAASPLFEDKVGYLRARYFLSVQSQRRFWRRSGFAILLGLWSTLFFLTLDKTNTADSSALLSYSPALLQYRSPVMAAGFAGFYIYALAALIYRHRTGNMSSLLLGTLLVRGITGIMICSVIALIGAGEYEVPRTVLAFFVAIVPDSVIKTIGGIGKVPDVQFAVDSAGSFASLPSIGGVASGDDDDASARPTKSLARHWHHFVDIGGFGDKGVDGARDQADKLAKRLRELITQIDRP